MVATKPSRQRPMVAMPAMNEPGERLPVIERKVFLGLGSNLESPVDQLMRALDAVDGLELVDLEAVSRFYRSAPMGPQDQPDYVNAVAQLASGLSPHALLSALQRIERSQGRDRRKARHWGPRTIDLDILAWGSACVDSPDLSIPHPGIPEREFVLHPWLELTADFEIPGMGKVAELAEGVPLRGLEPITEGDACWSRAQGA